MMNASPMLHQMGMIQTIKKIQLVVIHSKPGPKTACENCLIGRMEITFQFNHRAMLFMAGSRRTQILARTNILTNQFDNADSACHYDDTANNGI